MHPHATCKSWELKDDMPVFCAARATDRKRFSWSTLHYKVNVGKSQLTGVPCLNLFKMVGNGLNMQKTYSPNYPLAIYGKSMALSIWRSANQLCCIARIWFTMWRVTNPMVTQKFKQFTVAYPKQIEFRNFHHCRMCYFVSYCLGRVSVEFDSPSVFSTDLYHLPPTRLLHNQKQFDNCCFGGELFIPVYHVIILTHSYSLSISDRKSNLKVVFSGLLPLFCFKVGLHGWVSIFRYSKLISTLTFSPLTFSALPARVWGLCSRHCGQRSFGKQDEQKLSGLVIYTPENLAWLKRNDPKLDRAVPKLLPNTRDETSNYLPSMDAASSAGSSDQ